MAVWVLEPDSDNTMDESSHSETIVAMEELFSIDVLMHRGPSAGGKDWS